MSIVSSPASFVVASNGVTAITFAIPGGTCAGYVGAVWTLQGYITGAGVIGNHPVNVLTGAPAYENAANFGPVILSGFGVMVAATSEQLADIVAVEGGTLDAEIAFTAVGFTLNVTSLTLTLQSCVISISPMMASFTDTGGSSTFAVTTSTPECPWAAIAEQSWLHTSSTGTGDGTVSYTVDVNSDGSRVGTILVCDQVYTVGQAGIPAQVGGPNPGGPGSGGGANESGPLAGLYHVHALDGNRNSVTFHVRFPEGYAPQTNLYSYAGAPKTLPFADVAPLGFALGVVTEGVLTLIDPVMGTELMAGDTRVAGCDVWLVEEGTQ